MKIKIVGQCKGGNAVLWFNLFNNHLDEYPEIENLLYICRTGCKPKSNFPIIKLYGKSNAIYKRPWSSFVYRFGLEYFAKKYSKKYPYDIIHLQGIYSPTYNRRIIDNTKEKVVLNIFGSDFYQNWFKENQSIKYRDDFMYVCDHASVITCNWITTMNDFLAEFPKYENKTEYIPWGVDQKWVAKKKETNEKKQTVFLSTRALYPYNNVDKVIEAFCKVFQNDNTKKLIVLSGYGSSEKSIYKAKNIVKNYHKESDVEFIFDWISDEELIKLYDRADYNFCVGDTDQLTISIIYGLLRNCVNILSPITSYKDFKNLGYKSPIILNEVTTNSLEEFFNNYESLSVSSLDDDCLKAKEEWLFKDNYLKYIKLYKSIINDSQL